MATTYKQKLFTGRSVEFSALKMHHFDLFLENLNKNNSLLHFYMDLLIEHNILVAIEVEKGTEEKPEKVFSKEEKDKLTLLPCELYETMFYVRLKSIGIELIVSHDWEKGKATLHTIDASNLDNFIIDSKLPSVEEMLELELSDKRVVTIQKGTIGQLRKHSHNIKKGNATEMISMHNPKQKVIKDGKEVVPISISISELKKLSWSDSPKLIKLCSQANGSYSIAVQISNPLDKSETKKIDLLSYEGFAAFFGLEDSFV